MSTLIPAAALDSHIGILGKTGSGKSNLAKVIAEKLMAAGDRVCVIDPTGGWYGLRLREDGKKPSDFKPIIFGGEHGDIPISDQHGAIIAEAIGTSSDSAIIDTRLMTVGQRTRFFTDFAEALLRFNRGPLHLIVDEAHLFAPKGRVNDPAAGKMLSATNNMVSLGRGLGLRIIMITQRPAKLHNDSLSQVETMILMRLIAPHDRGAAMDWVGEWADVAKGKEIVGSLPSLPVGDAWIWSPQIDHLERVHAPLAATFDSGKPLSRDAAAPILVPIDVDSIGAKMDTIRQEAMANDPARLKKRVAELEKALSHSSTSNDGAKRDMVAVEAADRAGFVRGHQVGVDEGAKRGAAAERQRLGQIVMNFAGDFALQTQESASPVATGAQHFVAVPPPAEFVHSPTNDQIAHVMLENGTPAQKEQALQYAGVIPEKTAADISPSVRKIVDAVVAAYPIGISLATAAKRAGLSNRSSAYGKNLKDAAASPRIRDRGDGCFVAIGPEDGISVPRGISAFKEKLPPSYASMLTSIEAQRGAAIGLDEISALSGVSRTSSGLTAGIKELLALGLIEKVDSNYRISPDFGD